MSNVYKSKRKKDYPCLRCKVHVKKNEMAVKCALCDLWVHKECEGMEDETFKVLDIQNEEQGQCFWSCQSCRSYALKFDKRIRDVEKRVREIEEKTLPKMETDISSNKEEIVVLKETTAKLVKESRENPSSTREEVAGSVFEELRERETRRCNLVIHNLIEPSTDITDKMERIMKDKEHLQELFDVVNAEINVFESTRFANRLGLIDETNSTPRPLLVGLDSEEKCKKVLDRSSMLSEKDEPWSNINIVRDLTKLQRKEENKLRDEVAKKNSELTDEDAENWVWKVVGRRGERRIVKAKLDDASQQGGNPQSRSRGQRQRRGQRRGQIRGRGRAPQL